MDFVARLEGLIRAKGLNWMVVSRELKIGKNQMRYWEAQNCLPNGETLKKLADYFDVSIDYLVNGEDPSTVFSTDDPVVYASFGTKDGNKTYGEVMREAASKIRVSRPSAPLEQQLLDVFRSVSTLSQLRIIQTIMNIKDEDDKQ